MKKLLIVLVICLCFSAAVYADHPGGLGLGAVIRGGGGNDGFSGFDIGASVKFPSLPIFWGFFAKIHSEYFGFGAIGDFYLIDADVIDESGFNLDWFLGVGGYGNMVFWGDGLGLSAGGRLPIGLSCHITNNWEVFLDVAPNLGLSLAPEFHFPDFFVTGELGFRYWF
jgi:hypothetical protein